MSDAPVIFKRTKAKANQRAREEPKQDAQDQSVNLTEDEPSPSAVASKIKNKAKQRAKPKTALSFGAEEEVRRYDTHFLNLHPSTHRKEMKKSSKLKSPTSVRNCLSGGTQRRQGENTATTSWILCSPLVSCKGASI
jgi:hypothetical protein